MPEPVDGDLLWSVPPDEGDYRSVSLVEGGVLLDIDSTYAIGDFTEVRADGETSERGVIRAFVLVDALTGQTKGIMVRSNARSSSGLLSNTVPLAADVRLLSTAAEGLAAGSATWNVTLVDVANSSNRWTVSVGEPTSPDSTDGPTLVAVTPDVVIIDVGGHRPDYVALSAQDGSQVWAIDPGEDSFGRVSPDGSRLAYVTDRYSDQGATLVIVDTATGTERARMPFPRPEAVNAPEWVGNTVVAFRGSDGSEPATLLITVGTDGTTGNSVTVHGSVSSVSYTQLGVAVNEDGSLVVLALDTGLLAVDPHSGATVWEVPRDGDRIAELVAVRGGKVMVNASDDSDNGTQGVVLDAATGEQLDIIRDAIHFESIGAFDGSVFVWSATSRTMSLASDDHQVLVFKASQPPIGLSGTGELVLP